MLAHTPFVPPSPCSHRIAAASLTVNNGLSRLQGSVVEVVWETQEPYQSTLSFSPPDSEPAGTASSQPAVVQGLTIRHYSKSVANNYAVFLQNSNVRLEDCDISSSSGAGVGIEGAQPQLKKCNVHDCERHGVAIFGGMLGEPGGGVLQDCTIAGNKSNGVLIRDGATPVLKSNRIAGNKQYGVFIADAAAEFTKNEVKGNKQGSIAVRGDADVSDAQLQQIGNTLDKPVKFL